jgi:molybdate transport system substrate-binding protein
MSTKRARLGAVGLVILAVLTQPGVARAAEIKVLCSNGIKAVMEELVPQFEQATKHKVMITYGLSAALKRRIEAGEAFDMAVLTPALVDDLIKQGTIAGDTRTVLARAGITIGIRRRLPAGHPHDRCRQACAARRSPSHTRGAGGVFFVDLAQRLGIADSVKSKIKPTTTGDEVGVALARGDAELGVLPLSELMTFHGVEVVGTFPQEVQGYAVMVAGASARTNHGDAAKALMSFVTAPAALSVIKKKGMERN